MAISSDLNEQEPGLLDPKVRAAYQIMLEGTLARETTIALSCIAQVDPEAYRYLRRSPYTDTYTVEHEARKHWVRLIFQWF